MKQIYSQRYNKHWKDSNQFIKLYHVSPEKLWKLSPESDFFGYKGLYFSPTYRSTFADWVPYVRGKKKAKDGYNTLFLYTVICPKWVYDKMMLVYNKVQNKEADDISIFTYWGWGDQIFITSEYLDKLKVISIKRMDKEKLYDEYRKTTRKPRGYDDPEYKKWTKYIKSIEDKKEEFDADNKWKL